MNLLDPRQRAMAGMFRGLPASATGLPQAPSLGEIFAPPPRPVAVSPGSPAPMQPGVDIQPPRTGLGGREILTPRAVAPAEAAVGDAAAADAARTAEERFGELYAKMREKSQAALRTAEADATVDPEQEAIFAKREAGLAEDREDVETTKKHRDWSSLVDLGVAMAGSNSPFFATALAEGLRAGNRGWDQARLDRTRSKALIRDKEDQIAQARYQALAGARADARRKIIEDADLTATEIKTAALTDEAILKKATSQSAIKKAMAEASSAETDAAYAGRSAEADIGYKNAAAAAAYANANESNAGAAAYQAGTRGGGRNGRGLDGDRYDREELDKARAESEEARLLFRGMVEGLGGRAPRGKQATDIAAAHAKAVAATNKWNRMRGAPAVGSARTKALAPGAPAPTANPLGLDI